MDTQTIDRFKETYGRLLVQELQQRVGFNLQTVHISDSDASFLVTTASALALGSPTTDEIVDAEWKKWAYDVATRLAEGRSHSDSRYRRAAEIILARLGNFPGRDFLRATLPDGSNSGRYPGVLALESLTHEAENTLEFSGLGNKTLTDFQVRLIRSLRRNRPVSVSAPTSAGKSYLLALDIVSLLASQTASVVVYVVPTRALIRQVMTDLLAQLREAKLDEVAVSAAPVIFDDEQLAKGVVYVLTQERLLSLIYSSLGTVRIDALYVDEAQEIGDEERGMILHTAVLRVLKTNPGSRVCFASPLTRNPGFLFGEFEVQERGEFFVERQAPVSQAVVILDEVADRAKDIRVTVLTPSGPQLVTTLTAGFDFRGVKSRLANTAVLVTHEGESTIVYANGAAEAIDVALNIADLIETKTKHDEVRHLVDFVKTHIHSQYALVDTLPKGVAFHYGKMPHLVRSQIEELLKNRKLKYVVCTSTLLQGVNLPARNIVMFRPRKGNRQPMRSPDFWNLAGRAGRLKETFNGYIWCINPKTWEGDPLNGNQLSEMTSSFRESLQNRQVAEGLIGVLSGATPLSDVSNRGRVEQLFGKVFSEFTSQQLRVGQSLYAADADPVQVARIDTECAAVLGRIKVPAEVCQRNSVISPLSLDELWTRFSRAQFIEQMIPADPSGPDGLDRMRSIFRTIDEVFIGSGTRAWNYYATLAYFWVTGRTLKDLISNHLSFNNVPANPKATNAAIRDFLESLEQDVRFVYVKYIKAYIDALQTFLTHVKKDTLKASVSPLHLYIEFGAKDQVLVMLMSLGISRTTAIFIRDTITNKDEIGRNECWEKLKRLPLRAMSLPEVCKEEIRQLTGQR